MKKKHDQERSRDTISPYPLTWPPGKPRTPAKDRKFGRFGKRSPGRFGITDITVTQALARIKQEAGAYSPGSYYTRIDPAEMIFSSNLRTRRDGDPASGQREPEDPGVAVYFELDGKPQCIAIDTYRKVADNFAAVAAALEALRALDRHGSGLLEAAFTGFTALPAPDQVLGWSWRTLFNYDGSSLEEARRIYRQLVRKHHPDAGGDANQYDLVLKGWKMAQEELGDG